MALDGTLLLAVKQELTPFVGGRVDKIYQPSRDELVIGMRAFAEGQNRQGKIFISASGTSGRIHLTREKIENPQTPPMFCMLMRKHFAGGRLTGLRQDGLERVLTLDFEVTNELGDTVTESIAVEIMGKYSNIIAIDSNGRIIDSIRRLDDLEAERIVLPGAVYSPPLRQKRLNFLIASPEDIMSVLQGYRGISLAKGIVSAFEGISPVLAREWLYRAGAESDVPSDEADSALCESITREIIASRERFLAGNRHYTILKTPQGEYKDLCFEDIRQYGSLMTAEECPTACEMLDRFYSEKDAYLRIKSRNAELYKQVNSIYDRIGRRLLNQKREMDGSRKRDEMKLKGDLIAANLYRLEKGMREFECTNLYSEKGETMRISLDPRLTPSQNMQKMYKAYRKADNAEKTLKQIIAQGEEELRYIDSVRDALSRAVTEEDILELRTELAAQGYIRNKKNLPRKAPKIKPDEYTSPDGFTILVGRNNTQNDELTCRIAAKTDIWLHTKDITGSHVIIRTNGEDVPMETIVYAAGLAAANSSAARSGNVPVDYTYVKYVKKPAGAKPGMVIFTNNKTLYVDPIKQ